MDLDEVLAAANQAKDAGASRFCMGAAWRAPRDRELDDVIDMVKGVKRLGLETCLTLGMLTASQAERLADVGLDYYNHNLDTSRDFYQEIISTRTYDERLETLRNARDADLEICTGGILGMGESVRDRLKMLQELANMDPPPESVPINALVAVEGTPLARGQIRVVALNEPICELPLRSEKLNHLDPGDRLL